MPKKNKCDCEFCELYKLRTQALETDNIEFVKKIMEKFSDLWLCVDEDLNYQNCILDGSWPGSVEILEKSLKKAAENSDYTTTELKNKSIFVKNAFLEKRIKDLKKTIKILKKKNKKLNKFKRPDIIDI